MYLYVWEILYALEILYLMMFICDIIYDIIDNIYIVFVKIKYNNIYLQNKKWNTDFDF